MRTSLKTYWINHPNTLKVFSKAVIQNRYIFCNKPFLVRGLFQKVVRGSRRGEEKRQKFQDV